MKTTYEKMFNFSACAARWLTRADEEPGNPKTKLAYAIYRLSSQVAAHEKRYAEKREDIRMAHAAVDEKGLVVKDGEEYRFTRDGLKSCTADIRKLFETEEIEITPHYATVVPELTEAEWDRMEGFVLDPQMRPVPSTEMMPVQALESAVATTQ